MPRRASIRLVLSIVVAGALAMISVTTPHAQGPVPTGDIPRLPFEKYTLPNGLEVILSQKTALPMVSVNLWYHGRFPHPVTGSSRCQ
jgi:zinc protease